MPLKAANQSQTQPQKQPKKDGQYRRRQAARRKMIVAANELFEENGGIGHGGFENTTVEMIVERAHVSRRTFFNHFRSKADVLLLDQVRGMEDFLDAFSRRPEDEHPVASSMAALQEITETFFTDPINIERAKRTTLLSHKVASTQILNALEFEQRLAKMIESRLTGKEKRLRADLMAKFVFSINRLTFDEWAAKGMKTRYSDHLEKNYSLAQQVFRQSGEL